MKNTLLYFLISLLCFNITFEFSNSRFDKNTLNSPSSPYQFNPFKNGNDPSAHSLFTDGTTKSDNVSTYPYARPILKKQPMPQGNDFVFNPSVTDPKEAIARKVVNHYYKLFETLDTDKNGLITPAELTKAYSDFLWPKKLTETPTDDCEYAKGEVKNYDKDNKGAINFPEFTNLCEELFDVADRNKEEDCTNAYKKSMKVFENLFTWLDRDKKGKIGAMDMLLGISKIMYRDAYQNEIEKLINRFKTPDGMITKDQFILGIANGDLDKSLSQ